MESTSTKNAMFCFKKSPLILCDPDLKEAVRIVHLHALGDHSDEPVTFPPWLDWESERWSWSDEEILQVCV